MPAFYSNTLQNFAQHSDEAIIGALSSNYETAGYFQLLSKQTSAWKQQITILKQALTNSVGDILFEYPIPRRGKRIDNVLLMQGHIVVIECKIGAFDYLKADQEQLEDYCLDLQDFHQASHHKWIIPILLASDAPDPRDRDSMLLDNPVLPVQFANKQNLGYILSTVLAALPPAHGPLERKAWEYSHYEPTPTIIETAQQLYAGQNVAEITRSHAGAENLTVTSNFVIQAIEQAKQCHEKMICFITGVPGAGKTLAGLNIVHSKDLHEGDLGAFLSGNIPLVDVLSEALARDDKSRTNKPMGESRRHIKTFIQKTQDFLKEYYDKPERLPVDRIIVFDEAQRAWDKEQTAKHYASVISQPQMMLEIMDRHPDWAVIIALIGGGQEINTGEAGLPEWGRALAENFPHWKILISNELKEGRHATGGQCLFKEMPAYLNIQESPSLHLKVSLRSFKAEKLSEFVEHLLTNQSNQAASTLATALCDFPIAFTRSLETAKNWLKDKHRGTRRIGLVASSGARRIKAHGLNVQQQLDYVNWLLNPPDDVRSSYFLEDPATEFSIQGLELDWVGVCWGGDLCYQENQWQFRKFSGTKWQNVNKESKQQFLINKYRVLLTRAREGMILWIPPGSNTDLTRAPEVYNGTAQYLARIGITEL